MTTRGNELLRAKDLAGALAAYTQAISLDGSDAAFRSNRSVVYMSMGEHEKALLDAEVGTVSCLQEVYRVIMSVHFYRAGTDRFNQHVDTIGLDSW